MSRRKTVGFKRSVIKDAGEDWEEVRQFNYVLRRLTKRRLRKIERVGPLESMLAWKIVALQQALLYRIVELATGCIRMWNAGNVLCAVLAARALMETIALVLHFDGKLQKQYQENDFKAMEKLVTRHTLSSREAEATAEYPDLRADSVLNYIDHLEKISKYPARKHYESMSEFCHPNSDGHYFSFAKLDTDTGTVAFSSRKTHGNVQLKSILIVYIMLGFVESWMSKLDELVPKIAEAHPPVKAFPQGRD
jgi:hypothetical protein